LRQLTELSGQFGEVLIGACFKVNWNLSGSSVCRCFDCIKTLQSDRTIDCTTALEDAQCHHVLGLTASAINGVEIGHGRFDGVCYLFRGVHCFVGEDVDELVDEEGEDSQENDESDKYSAGTFLPNRTVS
jgi:hypothetical protein